MPGRPDLPGTVAQRALFAEGLLASSADAVLPFLPVYLVALSASATQVGLLSSASGLAGLAALGLGAWGARRAASRRVQLLLGTGAAARLTLLLMASAPLFLHGETLVLALIVLGAFRSLAALAAQPAWTAVFADVVPEGRRQRFSSWRSLAMGVAAMLAAPALGWLIARSGGVEGFQQAFLLAALVGCAGTLALTRINLQEAPVEPRAAARLSLLRDATFRRFVTASVCVQVFAMMAGPLFIVYLVRDLGASPAQVGALASLDPVAAVGGQAVASALVVRCAPRKLLIATLLVSPCMPLLWLVITDPWQAAIPNLLGGATWGVFHLAAFNLLLQVAPRDDLPRYAATLQATGLVAAFVGPLAGGALVALGGIPLVFAISSLGRVAALALFIAPFPARRAEPLR